jgi:hypothetical protein
MTDLTVAGVFPAIPGTARTCAECGTDNVSTWCPMCGITLCEACAGCVLSHDCASTPMPPRLGCRLNTEKIARMAAGPIPLNLSNMVLWTGRLERVRPGDVVEVVPAERRLGSYSYIGVVIDMTRDQRSVGVHIS